MPHEGFALVTIRKEVRHKLEKLAEKEYTTVPRLIEKLVDEAMKKKPVEVPAS